MTDKFSPRPYQLRAIDFVVKTPRCALHLAMGLGKTSIVASAFAHLKKTKDSQHMLVLCPKRVAKVWEDEIQKWRHTSHLSVGIATGTAVERKKAIASKPDILVINYENVSWLLKEMLGGKWYWDMVVCDESDKLKSHDSVRFKGRMSEKQPGLKHVAPKVKRWVNMTGTPAASGLLDLWSQIHLVNPDLLGKNITAYRQRWFREDWNGYNYKPLPGAEAEILTLIEPYCLTMRSEDYLDLPPLIINDVAIELPAEAEAVYKQMKDEFIVNINDTPVTAANAAVLTSKLLQVTSGFLYHGEDKQYEVLHNEKLDALEDIISENSGAPILVFYFWKASLERLTKRFKKAVVLDKRGDAIKPFNEGRIDMLLAHPMSAGHGLSLHHSCSTAVFFDLDWDLRTYQQAIERIGPTRQAQGGYNRTVVVHRLLATGTVDQAVKKRLDTKADIQDVILDWMKE